MIDDFMKNEMQNSYVLHWNYRNLIHFPEELKDYGKHLEDIYLKGNKINNVPKWIIDFKSLSEIHLAENELKEIPEEISHLKYLKLLDVSTNQIAELPKSVTCLQQLQNLNVSNNLLTKLPQDVGKLKSLLYVYASHNYISIIPNSIIDCVSLRELDLEFNRITFLPMEMVKMQNLECVSVRNNNLLYLPALPFQTRPILLIGENENFNHWSYDVFCLWRDGQQRLILDVLTSSQGKKNVQQTIRIQPGHSIIYTQFGRRLIIPMTLINPENTKSDITLREICLRKFNRGNISIKDLKLPECILNEINNGPTARCQECKSGLFQHAFLRILQNEEEPNTPNIIQYFCNNSCIKIFKSKENPTSSHEIPCIWDKQ